MNFLIEYRSCFYIGWVVLLLLKSSINLIIYIRLGNDEVDSLSSIWKNDHGAMVLIFFTFWWPEHRSEKNNLTKKLMKFTNTSTLVFACYTLFVMFVIYESNNHFFTK